MANNKTHTKNTHTTKDYTHTTIMLQKNQSKSTLAVPSGFSWTDGSSSPSLRYSKWKTSTILVDGWTLKIFHVPRGYLFNFKKITKRFLVFASVMKKEPQYSSSFDTMSSNLSEEMKPRSRSTSGLVQRIHALAIVANCFCVIVLICSDATGSEGDNRYRRVISALRSIKQRVALDPQCQFNEGPRIDIFACTNA